MARTRTGRTTTAEFLAMLRRTDYVVLDTETTALGRAEICQIAIVDASGAVLLDTLVRPTQPIPPFATRIHGITNEDVHDAPRFGDVLGDIAAALYDRDVIAYNASFDRKMLHLSGQICGAPPVEWKAISRWHCAMRAFAHVYAQRVPGAHAGRAQKLSAAAAFYAIPQHKAHTAVDDCITTLALCRAMASEPFTLPGQVTSR